MRILQVTVIRKVVTRFWTFQSKQSCHSPLPLEQERKNLRHIQGGTVYSTLECDAWWPKREIHWEINGMTDWPLTGHPSIAAGGYLIYERAFPVLILWTTAYLHGSFGSTTTTTFSAPIGALQPDDNYRKIHLPTHHPLPVTI